MNIISIASTKGGVGKSTLSVNLAGALSIKGPVALTDSDDLIGTSKTWIQRGGLPIPLVEVVPGPSPECHYWLIDVETRHPLKQLVHAKKKSVILLPTGVNGGETKPVIELWRQLTAMNPAMTNFRIVITRAERAEGQALAERLRDLGLDVCRTIIRPFLAYQLAYEEGVLVKDVDDVDADKAWSDILSLALEIS